MACGTQEPSPIIGSWFSCQRDGTYKEFKISEHYITTSISDFQEHDYDDGISFYECHIHDSLLIVSKGINVDLMGAPDTLRFESKSYDKIILENQFGSFELTRLKAEIPDIDSANFDRWSKLYLDKFLERAELANCPDIRTEEERTPVLIDLGEIEDDFEELEEVKN
jgi:hypothetical protein